MRSILFIFIAISEFILKNAISETANSLLGEKTEIFSQRLQQFDLNADIEQGSSITASEYEQLQTMWDGFSEKTKIEYLHGPEGQRWKNFYAILLLYDLNNEITWQDHVEILTQNKAVGLALTTSFFNHPVALETARKTIVDLLITGEEMFRNGQLLISEKIKTAAAERTGKRARQRLESWEKLINGFQQSSMWKKVVAVNNFFNQEIRSESDRLSASEDYWQSPIETLVRGAGDCEDFAIGKYVSLRLLGLPVKQLSLAVLKDDADNGHAVLLYYPQNVGYPVVLDQIDFRCSRFGKDSILALSLWRSMRRMNPVFEINEDSFTVFGSGQERSVTSDKPLASFPKFSYAIKNSRRLLPSSN